MSGIRTTLLAASLLAPATALAKPRPGGAEPEAGGVHRHVERRDDGAGEPGFPVHSIGAAAVVDGPLHGADGSYGVAAEYRLRLTDVWGLLAGTELRFRPDDTLIEPFVAGEAMLLETRHVDIAGGGGLAVPVAIEPGITHVALALRASAMARWMWPLTDLVTPYAQAVALVGPVLTPESPHDVHAALQLWVGASLNL